MQGTTEHDTESGKPVRYRFIVKDGSEANNMSTVSKLGTGIQSPTDSEDYFVCKLCLKIDRNRRYGTTFENMPYSASRR